MEFDSNFSGGSWSGEASTVAALNKPFWVKVLSFDAVRFYSWAEYYPTATGTFALLPGGRTGTVTLFPFFEANGNAITINSFVLIRQAYFDPVYSWVYVVVGTASTGGGSSSLTVENLDGTGVTTNTTTIKTDQTTGLVSSNIGPNMAEIRIEWSATNPTPTPIYPPVPDPTSGGGGTVTPPAGTTKLIFTPSSSETVGAIAAGISGQLLYLANQGSAKVTLTSGASIRTPLGVDYDLQPGREIQLEYLGSISRWVFAHPTLRTGTEYGTDQITAGTNITITPNGDGSASINAAAVAAATADIHGWHHGGNWYGWFPGGIVSGAEGADPTFYFACPFLTTQALTASNIGVQAGNNDAVSHNIRLAIYSNTSASVLYPNTLLFDSGNINVGPSGGALAGRSAVCGTALATNLYWLVLAADDTTINFQTVLIPAANANTFIYGLLGATTLSNTLHGGWTVPVAGYGAFLATFPAIGGATATQGCPFIMLQV